MTLETKRSIRWVMAMLPVAVIGGVLYAWAGRDPAPLRMIPTAPARASFVAPLGNAHPRAIEPESAEPTAAERVEDALETGRKRGAANDPRGGLDAYDEAFALLRRAYSTAGNRFESAELRALHDEACVRAEALSRALYGSDYEAAAPVLDLLAPEMRGSWGRTRGSEMTFDDRALEVKGGTRDSMKQRGVVSVAGWEPPWRDVVLDLQFTIEAGDFDLLTRYRPDERPYTVTFDPRNGYELGEPHHVVLRLIGRRVEMLQPDQPPLTDMIDPGMSRRGGFGFALLPGARVTISRCRATILR